MASQRITVAKVGGRSAEVAGAMLREFAEARTTDDPKEWSSDQWPEAVRDRIDGFAEKLRAHGGSPPVVSFAEWSDPWSMGDLFARCLTPPDGPGPIVLRGSRIEVYGYELPDDGRLRGHLEGAAAQQFAESDHLLARFREAVEDRDETGDGSLLLVLREPTAGLVTDGEPPVAKSFGPDWLSQSSEPPQAEAGTEGVGLDRISSGPEPLHRRAVEPTITERAYNDESPDAWGWLPLSRTLLAGFTLMVAIALIVLGERGEGKTVPETALAIDPNSAPPQVLGALPRIGPTLAGAIAREREKGPFGSLDDLDRRVRGIGPATRGAIGPFLRFDGGEATPH